MDKQSADRIKELFENAAKADASKKLQEQGEAQRRTTFFQAFAELREQVIRPAFEDFSNEIKRYGLNAAITTDADVGGDSINAQKNARIQINIGKDANLNWGHLAYECLADRLVVGAQWAPQREKISETAIKKNLQLAEVTTASITQVLVSMLEIMLKPK
jgi:hypothetical protein